MAVDNNEEKNKIVLNRKMRLWNKYKKPVIGVILAVVVIAVVAIVLKLCSIGKPVEDKATTLANNNNNNNNNNTAYIPYSINRFVINVNLYPTPFVLNDIRLTPNVNIYGDSATITVPSLPLTAI